MRVAIRTDASRRIGTGHLRRCQSVADALRREGAEAVFVCRAHDEISRVADQGRVIWLSHEQGFTAQAGDPTHAQWAACNWDRDADQTVAALQGQAVDWVLVDHYAFDARWHERVAGALHCRVGVIDDLADRPLAAQLVVDQNLAADHASKYAGVLQSPALILGGPRYAMLAPVYRTAPRYRFRRRVASIGIFMGGGDPNDFGSRVLRACRDVAGFDGDIELVSSSRNPNFEHHVALAQRWPRTHVLHDQADLSGFFARHDLHVGSGGIAAWERCCLRAPTLAIQIAQNQRAVLPQLAQLGAIEWLQQADPDEADIGTAVRELVESPHRRLALVRATRGWVDGFGSARVAAAMSLAARPELQLREASASDEALLLEWANDPGVRRQGFSTKAIGASEHHAWFARRLANPACRIFIASSRAGMPVAQVRFEKRGAHWVIGYSIDAAFRGCGLARPLLAGTMAALQQHDPAARFEAWVKPDNGASLRTFRGLGFAEVRVEREGIDCHRFEL
ncbi:MAG TPA: UDP-2,4-diacetamido-2,4,6-trideoxy-beta-L-altropyranose hydrolase [Ramlibacter sp.]